jgi:sugar-phosphatase
MIDTVIFDMDGLLVNSEPLWVEGMQEVFATVDVTITPELAAQTTGLRTIEVLDYWFEYFKWEGKSKEQIGQEIIDSVTAKVFSSGGLMEGVEDTIELVKSMNLKLGVASSSPVRFIDSVLNHFALKDYFTAVASAEIEPYGKPHPAVYLSCAKKLNSSPLKCLAFEDSINGMVAAKAARMKVVVVPEEHNRFNKGYALADLQLNSLAGFDKQILKSLGEG